MEYVLNLEEKKEKIDKALSLIKELNELNKILSKNDVNLDIGRSGLNITVKYIVIFQ